MADRWGDAGRHGTGGQHLFSPTPGWLVTGVVVWLAAMAHQRTCETRVAGQNVNALLRLCYSDLPITFQNQLAAGHSPYAGTSPVDQPPLVALVMVVLREVVGLVHPVGAGVTGQQALDGANLFTMVAAVLFGGCFLVVLFAQLAIRGRLAPGRRASGWVLAALCLTAFTVGIVNWQLLAAALLMGSLWSWHTRRWISSGLLAGLAVSASGHLLALIPVLAVLCLRDLDWSRLLRTAGVASLVTVVVNLPAVLLWPSGWTTWVTSQLLPPVGLGGLWQELLPDGPVQVVVARVLVALTVLGIVAVLLLTLLGHLTPRPEQLLLVTLGLTFILAPGYSPQLALLLVPLVALSRPAGWTAVLAASEALYWAAVFAFLNGSLRFGERGGETPYALAVVVRLTVLLVVTLSVLAETWTARPERGLAP
ncbi:hypothetical protein [Aestuariimicrobium sp. T2.26MG-19.2B]|uniref:hypothetical protein n=1 Tax=Aestuariimicrobium sp. T2.26MG-19.2B TaxID=3040679 RepID=UPI0024779230|nr:hypothetical protein [Aestuariimicrobium sp. T2.26MG-19.2B]CAI9403074.1 hypothetical protein AESSP_00930 [Aestuariimicrobium sp. T2.26MG-19.2B]